MIDGTAAQTPDSTAEKDDNRPPRDVTHDLVVHLGKVRFEYLGNISRLPCIQSRRGIRVGLEPRKKTRIEAAKRVHDCGNRLSWETIDAVVVIPGKEGR